MIGCRVNEIMHSVTKYYIVDSCKRGQFLICLASLIYLIPLLLDASVTEGGDKIPNPYAWSSYEYPLTKDLAQGFFAGRYKNNVLLFPESVTTSSDKSTTTIYGFQFDDEHGEIEAMGEIDIDYSIALCLSSDYGIILVPHLTGLKEEILYLVRVDNQNHLNRRAIISLPERAEPLAGAHSAGRIYLLASVASDKVRLFSFDVTKNAAEWENLGIVPYDIGERPFLNAQFNGKGYSLICFANPNLKEVVGERRLAIYEYDIDENKWQTQRIRSKIKSVPDPQFSFVAGTGHVVYFAEDRRSNSGRIFAFHTNTRTLVEIDSNYPWKDLESVVTNGEELLFLQRNRDRLTINRAQPNLTEAHKLAIFDYLTLLCYFVLLVWMGVFFSKRTKDTNDYFKAGGRIPGWAAGISIFATKISAVTFVATPAITYGRDWLYFGTLLGPAFAALLAIRFVLPFYCGLNLTTAYEYLEKRFHVSVRTLGALFYIVYQGLKMGVLVLLPSIVLSVVTGINIYLCILLIGVISTLYTYMGGIEAVIWTDVIQVIVMLFGALLVIFVALSGSGLDVKQSIDVLSNYNKIKFVDFSVSLRDVTILTVLLYWGGSLNIYMAEQSLVQRMVSTKGINEAAKALWTTAIVTVPFLMIIYFVGTAIFLFHYGNPEKIHLMMRQPDELLPWFIVKEITPGVAGIILGAIFAATMSSLDSGINSACTVLIKDVYQRFWRNWTEQDSLRLAKIVTIFLGIFGTCFALFLSTVKVTSIFDTFFMIISLMMGVMAGVFALGIFTVRGNAVGAFFGFVLGMGVQVTLKTGTDISFFIFQITGLVSSAGFGYLFSCIFTGGPRHVQGLTIFTRDSKLD